MEPYPSIADHGLIGHLQTAALVATDGTVDWFCCPWNPERGAFTQHGTSMPPDDR